MRNLVLLAAACLFGLFLFTSLANKDPSSNFPEVTYSDFKKDVTDNKVSQVEIKGKKLIVHTTEDKWYYVNSSGNANLADVLSDKNIMVKVAEEPTSGGLLSVILGWLPMILLIGVWIYFMKNMQGKGGLGGFGQSKAKLLVQNDNRVTFADVAGCDEAKQEVQEIVQFLQNPTKFCKLGGRIPRGVLMVGPPGTGKTLLARAIAGEANVPFFSISGSDFVEMFVGVGAARVRDMFTQAKKNAPCIIFIDEIDAVGRHRGAGLGGGNDEREQTLNSILVEMDGFESNESIIIIAATNRPDVLDPALLRPGRFDRQVVIPNPDLLGREQILNVHLKKIVLASTWTDQDTRIIARKTPGMSGADLANLCNEAALMAGRAGRQAVVLADFETASDKIMMGTERRNNALTENDKRLIAYHEAGHAVVGLNCETHDPLHKITIIPRGRAMGVTMSLPEKDRWGWTKQELLDKLAVFYGGRCAEIMMFGENNVTTGAGNDIQQATNIARLMVKQYGMGSDAVGRIRYDSDQEEIFLGRSITQSTHISQKYAELVDNEVKVILAAAEERAKQILENKIEDLNKITEALLVYETLDGKEVDRLLAGEDISKPDVLPDDEAEEIRKQFRKGSVPNSPLS